MDNDFTPITIKGEKKRRNKRRPQGKISERRAWIQKRIGGSEMCNLPMFNQKRAYEDWISELACWFRAPDSCQLSDVLEEMIPMFEVDRKQG